MWRQRRAVAGLPGGPPPQAATVRRTASFRERLPATQMLLFLFVFLIVGQIEAIHGKSEAPQRTCEALSEKVKRFSQKK
jgi:hypothetical protein